MRVLALTNLYPNPRQPHRATFNRHQLRILGERTPVRIIAPIAWTDEWRLGRLDSRRREQDGLLVEHPRYWFPPRLFRGSYGRCFEASVRAAFRRAVVEFRPEIIFAPWAYPDGWAAGRLAHAAGLPCVVQVHGSDVLLLDEHPARRRPTAEALRSADGIVAVSQDLANRVVELGADRDRVRVIYDGVDPGIFRPGAKDDARARLGISSYGILHHHAGSRAVGGATVRISA